MLEGTEREEMLRRHVFISDCLELPSRLEKQSRRLKTTSTTPLSFLLLSFCHLAQACLGFRVWLCGFRIRIAWRVRRFKR